MQEDRGWKGERGSDTGELEELGFHPTISRTECFQLAHFSCSLLCFTSEYPVEHNVNGPMGGSGGNPLMVLRQRVGQSDSLSALWYFD